MAACKHANGRDWWIVMQEFESNCFFKCLLTPYGIDLIDKQCIGDTVHISCDNGSNTFTPDGNKYIWSSPLEGINILDFDRCNGEFSHHIRITTTDSLNIGACNLFHGVSVSPNSRYLYQASGSLLRQFDLQANDISQSEVLLANTTHASIPTYISYGQLAPNGKIYFLSIGLDTFIHVVNDPDLAGANCNFQENAIDLPTWNFHGLPYYPNYRLGALVGSGCDSLPTDLTPTLSKGEGVIQVYPNPASEYLIVDYGNVKWSAKNVILEIYNAIGETVYKTQLPRYSALQKIETVNWSKGVYFVTVKQAGIYAKPIKWVKE